MKRVMVIGCPGSGKTTFAEKLNKATENKIKEISVYSNFMDTFYPQYRKQKRTPGVLFCLGCDWMRLVLRSKVWVLIPAKRKSSHSDFSTKSTLLGGGNSTLSEEIGRINFIFTKCRFCVIIKKECASNERIQ